MKTGLQQVFDAVQTAACLPFGRLATEIATLLEDASVQVPKRLVQALPGGGSLFVMPALDGRVAITKIISFTPANAGTARASIQGDVLVFNVATGERILVLDGPTVTARRTAAVSLLAAQRLASQPGGPLLIVGAGVQGKAHLEAFAHGLPIQQVYIASRTPASAAALVAHAQSLGLQAATCPDADAALAYCPLVVTCTPANVVVLHGPVRPDAFVAAIGAFTPHMRELSASLCQQFAHTGRIVLDTPHGHHEAGDLIQANLPAASYPSLAQVLQQAKSDSTQHNANPGPVLFKSCGWAGWDLAAARLAVKF